MEYTEHECQFEDGFYMVSGTAIYDVDGAGAELTAFEIGGLTLTRDQLVKAFTQAQVARAEELAFDAQQMEWVA